MTHYIDMALYWHHLEGGADDICDLKYTNNIKPLKGKVKICGTGTGSIISLIPQLQDQLLKKLSNTHSCCADGSAQPAGARMVSIFFFPSENKHANEGKRTIPHFIE